MKLRCDVPGCREEAVWRQFDPVDTSQPTYLCARHWNEMRIIDFDRSTRYSAARLFPEDAAQLSP